jgi:hypothetical protein
MQSYTAIFYDLVDCQSKPLRSDKCTVCGNEYDHRYRKPVQCRFCADWNCSECICQRKRYHPRAKESNSDRFEICHRCDDKFLNLTLNHVRIVSIRPTLKNGPCSKKLSNGFGKKKASLRKQSNKSENTRMNNKNLLTKTNSKYRHS